VLAPILINVTVSAKTVLIGTFCDIQAAVV